MKNIINEELNYMKYLFSYQRGKVISEQKNIILEKVEQQIFPETIVPCPSDPTELSKFIQVDDISSKEAKFYLDNVKIFNLKQKLNDDYYNLKSEGVKFYPHDKNVFIKEYPTIKNDLIDCFYVKMKKDLSGDIVYLYNDGSYKKNKYIDQEWLKSHWDPNTSNNISLYPVFSLSNFKQVCLKESKQISYPEETTTTTTTIKPQPVVSITPEPTNTMEYPEYNPPLKKTSFGYNPIGKTFSPFDNIARSDKQYGRGKFRSTRTKSDGFYPKYTKKMMEIQKYYYGYDDEDGNHIDGEIEKAKKQNRRINFLKPFSKDDISSQQTYNDEFDQYLQSRNQVSVKK